jgi:hypothetical protein
MVQVADTEEISESDARRDLYRNLVGAPGRETDAANRDYRTRLRMLLNARLVT